jgi:hypothetical protein
MIEVLKQALEALGPNAPECCGCRAEWQIAIESLRQTIAELENQEPVATVTSETGADITMSWWHEPALPIGTKLYTHPPQRTWVGLTDDEHCDIWYKESLDWMEYGKAIEAKLKELNT